MTTTFIRHELKAFLRATNTGKSIAVNIILGLFLLYFLVCAFAVGFFMDVFLEKAYHNENLVVAFCGIILVYYLIIINVICYQLNYNSQCKNQW